MSTYHEIEKIEEISSTSGTKPADAINAEADLERSAPNKEKFDSLLGSTTQAPPPESLKVEAVKPTSIAEEVQNLGQRADQAKRSSTQDLIVQANEMIAQIDGLKAKLATPNLELKGSVQHMLKTKLSHIDDGLRIALSKTGVEYTPPVAAPTTTTPIEKFLGYLTDGQHKLQNLSGELKVMQEKSSQITPMNMLAIQVKVGYIQQELEFFTGVLNKALESTKTLMNVQV